MKAKKKAPGTVAPESTKADYERKRVEIETAKLKPAPWNPRMAITPESVADLTASIATLGMIQPLVARMDKDGGATLIAGHRRLVAAKEAGLSTVPCDILVGVDEATARRMTVIENLQRTDADPLLESELVGGLVDDGMTQAEIAAETGRGEKWVARRMNLVNLSGSWRSRVREGERITTDCLEHVAAYPEEVQEKLRDAGRHRGDHDALRWSWIKRQFDCETCDLRAATFNTGACRKCVNNTGCSPDLFDWEGRVTRLGRCMDSKCYRRRTEEYVEATIEDAKYHGFEVSESEDHPDYSIDLQDGRDDTHSTLYVWKDYDGKRRMQWGEAPKRDAGDGGTAEEQKEERRRKIEANRARRKLAEWCRAHLAGVIALRFKTIGVQTVRAFQAVFDIGSSWRVFGSETNASDAARAYLMGEMDYAPKNWPELAAPEIAAKVVKPEIGARYAELLMAILPDAANALTDEERRLVVTDERLEKLREPLRVKWSKEEVLT